ncbi:hypothetical protein FEM48_Zijuj07G0119100 [Ziziphus jujuba var. spinosa]|uniref:Uncharacterized protein n=1 Tax=Ziziphus jujuba var. spinosa TaxID=714518 RepID=A0A978V4H2_ZIZJJ|nr:hypothetical protein FEM48_Zijuj07G0119100 [Ziziphus jujuba var. spinosa]
MHDSQSVGRSSNNFSRGRGFNNFLRGRGRNFFGRGGGGSKPTCQLCGVYGHVVAHCYRRFDRTFLGPNVGNTVSEVSYPPDPSNISNSSSDSSFQTATASFVFPTDDTKMLSGLAANCNTESSFILSSNKDLSCNVPVSKSTVSSKSPLLVQLFLVIKYQALKQLPREKVQLATKLGIIRIWGL